MFLCPRPFRRVHPSHVLSFLFTARSVPPGLHRYNTTSFHIPTDSHQRNIDIQREPAAEPIDRLVPRRDAPLHALTDKKLVRLINRIVETRRVLPRSVKHDPGSRYARAAGATYTNVYLELRRRQSHSLMNIPPEVFVHISEYSMVTGQKTTLNLVVEDILKITDSFNKGIGRGSVERHCRALENILDVTVSNHSGAPGGSLSPQQYTQVVNLCKALLLARRPSGVQPDLTVDCLNGVVRSIISQPFGWDTQNTPFLEALLHYVQNMASDKFIVDSRPAMHDASAKTQHQDYLSWNFLCLIRLLLDRGRHDLSFSFVQALVQKGIIPPQAINRSGAEIDFRVFMVSVLLRSCAHYGWPDRALELLRSEDLTKRELQGHYTKLVNDLLSAFLLDDKTKLEQCSQLICHVISHNPAIELNNTLVRAFFGIAYDVKAGKAAEVLYAALRSPSLRSRYMHATPDGPVLSWLLARLVHDSKNTLLGKLVAQDLVKLTKPLNLYERGDIIALCAAGGYVTETYRLWERYASGPEGKMVTGHTRCMIGIVKLFKSVSDITAKNGGDINHAFQDLNKSEDTTWSETALDLARGCSTSYGTSGHNAESMDKSFRAAFQRRIFSGISDSRIAAEGSASRVGTLEKTGIFSGSCTIAEADDHEPAATEISRTVVDPRHDTDKKGLPSINMYGVSEAVTGNAAATDNLGTDEYICFALKVLDAYCSANEPLHRASHYVLSALARASDVLGHVRQSMHALQAIVDRKEVPDTHDLNVVMTAMAARDPQRAEAMLVRMLEEGMHMNALSFSAVITGALKLGDKACASRVYSRAMRVGHKELTSEAATALLTTCLDACCPPGTAVVVQSPPETEAQKVFLRQAYSLITTKPHAKTIITRELGARCVGAALRLKEIGLAFHFWKQLVRTKASWDSHDHKEMRHAIIAMVEEALVEGRIEVDEGTRLISELGRLS